MIPYNTRKVTEEILEREEIRSGKISSKRTDPSWAETLPKPVLMKAVKSSAKELRREYYKPSRILERILHKITTPYRGGGVALFKEIKGATHVLIGQRRYNPFAGKWSFPGGGAEKEETLGKAAFRELKEELGVQLLKKNSKIVGRYEIDLPLFKWKTMLVKTETIILPNKKGQESLSKKYRNYFFGEFREVRWVPLSSLGEFNLHPCVMGAIKAFKESEK